MIPDSRDTVPLTPGLVSVVIPCFNSETTLERALRSVRMQDYRPIEIILVDDRSSDGTGAILDRAEKDGARVRRLPERSGAAAARNAGIAMARGEYIAFLDADDEWLPGKLSAQIALLAADPAMTFASCACRFVSHDGQDLGPLYQGYAPAAGPDAWKTLLAYNFVGTPSVVVRRSALDEVGVFNTALVVGEDQDLWIRLAIRGSVGYVDRHLVTVHWQPRSLSTEHADKSLRVGLHITHHYLDMQRHRLTWRERRFIRGHRYGKLGRNCLLKRPLIGSALLLGAAALGHEPLRNMLYLAQGLPPGQALKRLLRLGGADRRVALSTAAPASSPAVPKPDEFQPARFNASGWTPLSFDRADRPILMIAVDTEEEFDWNKPFSRDEVRVASMAAQYPMQRLLEKYGLKPAYLVDYAVASQRDGTAPLAEFLADGRCVVGAHLHPWITPPHDEVVCNRNSYPGNLPRALEREKIAVLTRAIEDNLGLRPRIYKAGRYGLGPHTFATLSELGYTVDMSALPGIDFSPVDGPDYRRVTAVPAWVDRPGGLLEIPMTRAHVGMLAGDLGRTSRLPAILARTRLLDRITLTPEGVTHDEHIQLLRALLRRGQRLFTLSYHSPSLMPGNTPYVRNARDLQRFLDRVERFCDVFFGDYGGIAMDPLTFRDRLDQDQDPHARHMIAPDRAA